MSRLDLLDSAPPRLLISVRDATEADLVAATGPCLVDAKDPDEGALGALPHTSVEAIVAAVGGRAPVSAVAGEPGTWEDLIDRVRAFGGAGVNLVKIAWPQTDRRPPPAIRDALRRLPYPVVAVFFAEDAPASVHVGAAVEAGFAGAMIDTAVKDGHTLLDRMSTSALVDFVEACRAQSLLSGLAGSLQLSHISRLAALRPGYIGLRGGLCRDGSRRSALDPDRVAAALFRLAAGHDPAAVG